MKSNDFDKVAHFYDRLASLVFGKSIRKAQTEYFDLIPPFSRLLIIGGGTGWILKEILDRQPEVSICYLEKSTRMIEKAKYKESDKKVQFINCPVEEWVTEIKFDFIICNFFLDVFQKEKLDRQIMPKIKNKMAIGGKLFVADFQTNGSNDNLLSQKILLWAMHRFFGVFSNMESDRLNDLNQSLKSNGFNVINEKYFFKEMIFSKVYELNS